MTNFPISQSLNKKSILVSSFKSINVVAVDEIIYIKAMQNYCMLYMKDNSRILSSTPFGKFFELVEFDGFYQCHKSYAIQVTSIQRYLKNGTLELEGRNIVPVARRRKKDFLDIMMHYDHRLSKKLTVRH